MPPLTKKPSCISKLATRMIYLARENLTPKSPNTFRIACKQTDRHTYMHTYNVMYVYTYITYYMCCIHKIQVVFPRWSWLRFYVAPEGFASQSYGSHGGGVGFEDSGSSLEFRVQAWGLEVQRWGVRRLGLCDRVDEQAYGPPEVRGGSYSRRVLLQLDR